MKFIQLFLTALNLGKWCLETIFGNLIRAMFSLVKLLPKDRLGGLNGLKTIFKDNNKLVVAPRMMMQLEWHTILLWYSHMIVFKYNNITHKKTQTCARLAQNGYWQFWQCLNLNFEFLKFKFRSMSMKMT